MAGTTQSMDFNPQTPIVVTNESNSDGSMTVVGSVVLAVIAILLVVVIWRYFVGSKRYTTIPGNPTDQELVDWSQQGQYYMSSSEILPENLLTVCDEFGASLNNAAADVDAYAEKKENMTAGIRHTPTEDMLWANTYM